MTEQAASLAGHCYLIMAGGTGGHVIPALTVAKELQSRGADIQWLGTRKGIEAKLVPAAGIELHFMDVEGVRGKGVSSLLKAPFLINKAIAQAAKVIRRLQPNAVLGMGGFASGPGGIAARLAGVPLVIHEQNAVAGTTNRLLAGLAAKRKLVAFPGALKDAEHTGNPIRAEVSALWQDKSRIDERLAKNEPPRLLILGGSMGALAINQMMPLALKKMDESLRPQVWHQCGERHLSMCREAYQQAGVEARVDAFIDDMAAAYAWADFIVCRAGALTVSEIAAVGIAALFIPFPHAIDDHQTKNAQWLLEAGAARIVQQSELDENKLAVLLNELLSDRDNLVEMAAKGRALASPNATERVADVCVEAGHG
ncbi:undecaprenyldiphospho-muramoylpentapeptide beta-N-acetylglucosaminyltransferase [Pseudoteredinibacter isoporae]|uniref:UDP-N-acetylglucosamine--N-acetylmuramyl-(pentapeptide) pyrophosphoryl-undecaprenol N-acetylglucosamine transferase n=1 Tax=Pseudoteredinibacter isoporae TaxID=570281 RepID=A0A7X0JUX1_9GAMM|nr:undecaprenyldiphospho-muramoylpentapeptide beta-N-acetylglucosaminyltransferase [Pseudoteredinibacter isoporae]MBB6522729.1 UDP-N-acetylglucosamine--N-acetylmuramyl-(pentapeptide) pyrophosphoryl-undecaprenol N-acetylglucosamine transferase [Pseudoteredinibacter isoporae]NHO88258.1 undecaprenyldiphospho-muramoylpentapeptide beta-N-acetylglucosaminyltransferase [Pseudoteredinibacter isoporae]NIB23411.1 undecaprenyldiphospho-muramoylpentapeptide beta-N-acetylglucosaminyltransferase [Pseudoteredi